MNATQWLLIVVVGVAVGALAGVGAFWVESGLSRAAFWMLALLIALTGIIAIRGAGHGRL